MKDKKKISKCEMTVSGEHVWKIEEFDIKYEFNDPTRIYGINSIPVYKVRCWACGLVNDKLKLKSND